MRDAGRAGFRRSVVGAIFFCQPRQLVGFFFDDRLANLPEGEGQAKRALSGLP